MHSPHDVGHSFSIDPGFFSHSPFFAQSPHAVSVSLQIRSHVPQLCAHIVASDSAFLPLHSPSFAQRWHDGFWSLQ